MDSTHPANADKQAVIFGAGAIGLAFLGDVLNQADYALVYMDIVPEQIAELNRRGAYEIHIVGRDVDRVRRIDRVRGVLTTDMAGDPASRQALLEAIDTCSIVLTAAGERALAPVGKLLATGLAHRWACERRALNVVCCENVKDPAGILRDAIRRHLPDELHPVLDTCCGISRAVISRMTPVVAGLDGITTEDYNEIPIEAAAWVGEPADIPALHPVANFDAYKVRKLVMHNATHATAAYLGYLLGKTDLGQCMQTPVIHQATAAAMRAAACAMVAEFGLDPDEQKRHGDDLLVRYDNPRLGHTCTNVGRDPLRKLAPADRLMTALRLCLRHGIDPAPFHLGIAAALLFAPPADPTAGDMHARLADVGPERFLQEHCGIGPGEALLTDIVALHRQLRDAHDAAQRAGNTQPVAQLIHEHAIAHGGGA